MAGGGEHVVQFYDHDEDLARAVGDYLTRAVSAGEMAIVIATEPHRRAFAAEMAGAGIDADQAVRDGTLLCLDAAHTLSRFVHGGSVDAHAFGAVVGSLVRDASRSGREIRAYGEMVALLWDAGDVLVAIEVEKLWNGLAEELDFSLWCAYHSQSVSGEEHADAFHQVCHLHSAVVDDARAEFRAGPDAPFAARRFVSGLLARRPYGDRVAAADARLVVSELATNAVIHAGTPFSVAVCCNGSALRIEVQDRSGAAPIMRSSTPTARSGRGLLLVDAVTRDWGVEPGPDGKTVWAELLLR
jgi:anti-sigma regulatory factor (Ser/Thr protein kinase)